MAIITISRGSYSSGKKVAEEVAKKLNYDCVSREVILDASEKYHTSEIKMVKAIHDAPSILERLGKSKKAFIAYYQSALAAAAQRDNIVYHGLAGHLLLKGIPHVLKVRIIADIEDRVQNEIKLTGVNEKEARALIIKDDHERRNWTKSLYGVDPWSSNLYDLVIHIHKFTVTDAVDIICDSARMEPFKSTEEGRQKMVDLVLASRIKASLIDIYGDIDVLSEYGNILVYTRADDRHLHKLEEKIELLQKENEGINNIELHRGVPVPSGVV